MRGHNKKVSPNHKKGITFDFFNETPLKNTKKKRVRKMTATLTTTMTTMMTITKSKNISTTMAMNTTKLMTTAGKT